MEENNSIDNTEITDHKSEEIQQPEKTETRGRPRKRTEAQQKAFEKARETRLRNIERRKQEKLEALKNTIKEAVKTPKPKLKKEKPKKKKLPPKREIYYPSTDDSSSESESEEESSSSEDEYIIRKVVKNKPKRKTIKPSRPTPEALELYNDFFYV